MKIFIKIIIVFFLMLSVYCCKGEPDDKLNTGKLTGKLINEIEQRIAKRDTNSILYIKDFTDFAWDSLYIISTGYSPSDIRKYFGIKYYDTSNISKNYNGLILFTSKDKIVYKEFFNWSTIDFENLFYSSYAPFYSRNSAVFRFKKDKSGYGPHTYTLSQIFTKDCKPTLFIVLDDGFLDHERIDVLLTAKEGKKKLFSGNLERKEFYDHNLFVTEIDRDKEYSIELYARDKKISTSYSIKIRNNPIIFLEVSLYHSGFNVIFSDTTLMYN